MAGSELSPVVCFLDESGTDAKDSDYAVVGGILLNRIHLPEFDKAWSDMLRYYRMSAGLHMRELGPRAVRKLGRCGYAACAVVELEHAAEPLTASDGASSDVDVVLGAMSVIAQTLGAAVPHDSDRRTLGRRPGDVLRRVARCRARHSALTDSTNRSANAFKFGLRAGRRTGVTPLSRSRSRKAAV